jgi:hypothetical protein
MNMDSPFFRYRRIGFRIRNFRMQGKEVSEYFRMQGKEDGLTMICMALNLFATM